MPSVVGNGVHAELQRYLKQEATVNKNWLIERNILQVIEGVRVSGRFDALYNLEDLYDIKVTKAYKMIKGDYDEWEKQLNAYDYMLWKDGISIKSLKIFMVISDWSLGEVWQMDYPDTNINIIPIRKWEREEQEDWMKTRVQLWKSSKDLSDQDLPMCTNEDRWATLPVFKLYRLPTLKRATKTFPSKARADAYLKTCINKNPDKWSSGIVRETSGDLWRRCGYCDARDFCNQFQNKIL